MADEDNGNGKKRPLTRAEKFKNYGIGIGAMSALLLGIWANVRGEPTAEKTWTTLRTQVNAVSDAVNKLTRRVVFLQAHESGRTAASIQLKLEEAEKKIARLEASLAARGASPAAPRVAAAPPPSSPEKKCKEGYVSVDNRCHRVSRAISKKLKAEKAETTRLTKQVAEEKRKRLEIERRKKALMQQLSTPPPPAPLPKLPAKLDQAAK